MKSIILLLFILLCGSAQAQIPNPFHKSVKGLSKKFLRKYPNDSVRAEAIYIWVTHYMRYDYRAYKKYKWKINSYSTSRVLYRRKAVCDGFAKLFQELCQSSQITCIKLEGYSYENKNDPFRHHYYANHAWNAVKLNGQWYLCDATLDDGYVKVKRRPFLKLLNHFTGIPFVYNKYKFVHKPTLNYYLAENYDFYKDHYPLLPNGLLSQTNIPLNDFREESLPLFSNYSACMDSSYYTLDAFTNKNKVDQMRIVGHEALRRNPNNHLSITLNYFN